MKNVSKLRLHISLCRSIYFILNFTVPDIIGDYVNTPMALRFNFQSLVAKVVRDKELLLGISPKPASKQDANGNEVWPTTPIMQLPKPSAAAAAPHDFLIGYFCSSNFFGFMLNVNIFS